MTGRRSRIEIVAAILDTCREGVGKTEILYSANMSYLQLTKYLDLLTARQFLCRTSGTFTTTELGKTLATYINIITLMLDDRRNDYETY